MKKLEKFVETAARATNLDGEVNRLRACGEREVIL